MQFQIEPVDATQDVVETAAYLAWLASGVFGLGALRDRGHMPQDEVLKAMRDAHDYGGDPHKRSKPGELNGDYVFGRMMKFWLRFDTEHGVVTINSGPIRSDYESWCVQYPSYEVLLQEAARHVSAKRKVDISLTPIVAEAAKTAG